MTRLTVLAGQRFDFASGPVSFSFVGPDVFLPERTSFVGGGTTQVDLRLEGSGGTFSLPPTSGSITYEYVAATRVPEPGGLWLPAFGLLALVAWRVQAPRGRRPSGG